MNKLEQLIKELCPNGVRFIKLNTVCSIYDGTHQTPNYTTSGVKFVSVENIGNLYATDKYISENDYTKYKIKPQINDVLMTRIGTIGVCAVVDRDTPLAYYVSLALLRPNNSFLNSKYLKYYIESKYGRKELYKRTLVNAVPIKVNMGDIGKIMIAIPPLEVQAEIVKILDEYSTSVTAFQQELEKELTARKKQYEYYRDLLLDFGVHGGGTSECEWRTIKEVCSISAGGDVPKDSFSKDKTDIFNIPIISNGIGDNALYGYTSIEKIAEPAVTVAARGTIGYAEYRDYPYYPIIRLLTVIPKEKNYLSTKYLYYVLQRQHYDVPKTGIPQLTSPMIQKISIPIPSIEEQKRIVSILDRFDKLCNDISEGLPAEIEARRKQYEYYRDKLLSFRPK